MDNDVIIFSHYFNVITFEQSNNNHTIDVSDSESPLSSDIFSVNAIKFTFYFTLTTILIYINGKTLDELAKKIKALTQLKI